MGSQTFVEGDLPQQEAASFADLIYETTTTPISDREWRALVEALSQPIWFEDERFTTVELRQKNINARLDLTQEVLRTRAAEEWLERLMHLAEKAGRFAPVDLRGRKEMLEWPFWQVGGLGWPGNSAISSIMRRASTPIRASAMPTSTRAASACSSVGSRAYLLGEDYSIADMASWPWMLIAKPLGQSLDAFPPLAQRD